MLPLLSQGKISSLALCSYDHHFLEMKSGHSSGDYRKSEELFLHILLCPVHTIHSSVMLLLPTLTVHNSFRARKRVWRRLSLYIFKCDKNVGYRDEDMWHEITPTKVFVRCYGYLLLKTWGIFMNASIIFYDLLILWYLTVPQSQVMFSLSVCEVLYSTWKYQSSSRRMHFCTGSISGMWVIIL
jgi:hypothetical protein